MGGNLVMKIEHKNKVIEIENNLEKSCHFSTANHEREVPIILHLSRSTARIWLWEAVQFMFYIPYCDVRHLFDCLFSI